MASVVDLVNGYKPNPLVGGGFFVALRNVQQLIISTIGIQYVNCHNHETTLSSMTSDHVLVI